jgi:dTDP-4-amino-4,6-dideoxygalactose transaminase
VDKSHYIPFNQPSVFGKELDYIQQAIDARHISGDGVFTGKCQALLEETLDDPKVLLTTPCTDALEMAALLLDIQPSDEVIVPPFAFVSTINAFVLRGSHPIFIDIRPDTLNLDDTQLESLMTRRTKAIVLVHYAGVGCEMDHILEIAGHYGIPVVEDNAYGLFGKYKGKYLGTFGCLATQSFHETKNFTCGEGSALLINDQHYIECAEIIRKKGTNRSRFFRGQVDKYTWVDIGSSYLPSDILAAFLYAELEAWERIQYGSTITRIFRSGRMGMVCGCRLFQYTVNMSYSMFFMLMSSFEQRQALIEHLKVNGVNSASHYLPLHLSEMGRRFGGTEGYV